MRKKPVIQCFRKTESGFRNFFIKLGSFCWNRTVNINDYFSIRINFFNCFDEFNVFINLLHDFFGCFSRQTKYKRVFRNDVKFFHSGSKCLYLFSGLSSAFVHLFEYCRIAGFCTKENHSASRFSH